MSFRIRSSATPTAAARQRSEQRPRVESSSSTTTTTTEKEGTLSWGSVLLGSFLGAAGTYILMEELRKKR